MRLAKLIFGVAACFSGFLLLGLVIIQIPGGIFTSDLWTSVLMLSAGVLLLAVGAQTLFNLVR